MKKIINSCAIAALILVGCGEKKEDKKATDKPVEPTFVIGIGKVLPDGGIVELSVSQSNKVVKLHKKLGDVVKEGEVLFEMESIDEQLQVEQNQASLRSSEESLKSANFDVQAAEVKLASLKKEYETSKRLLKSKAETAQKVFQDSVAYAEQMATVGRMKQNLLAQKASLNEQRIAVRASQVKQGKQSFKAMQAGTLIRFDVAVGAVLGVNATFGELAPDAPLVIEGELDELYANRIRNGQQVEIYLVGQTKLTAKGTISFVGTSLQNKSILYETVGEGSDRRVRRFTVKIDEGMEQLLINQKVECKIKL